MTGALVDDGVPVGALEPDAPGSGNEPFTGESTEFASATGSAATGSTGSPAARSPVAEPLDDVSGLTGAAPHNARKSTPAIATAAIATAASNSCLNIGAGPDASGPPAPARSPCDDTGAVTLKLTPDGGVGAAPVMPNAKAAPLIRGSDGMLGWLVWPGNDGADGAGVACLGCAGDPPDDVAAGGATDDASGSSADTEAADVTAFASTSPPPRWGSLSLAASAVLR